MHGGQPCDRRGAAGVVGSGRAGRGAKAVLQGLDTHPAGLRVSHIEHKLSISSGVGVTMGRGAD